MQWRGEPQDALNYWVLCSSLQLTTTRGMLRSVNSHISLRGTVMAMLFPLCKRKQKSTTAVSSKYKSITWTRKCKIKKSFWIYLLWSRLIQNKHHMSLYLQKHHLRDFVIHSGQRSGTQKKWLFPAIQWPGELIKQACGLQRKGQIILQCPTTSS